MKRQAAVELFMDGDATATALHVAVLEHFGTAIYDWDPQTLALEIQSDFFAEPIEANLERLHAMITAVGTDAFYKSVDGFYAISTAIEDGKARFEVFEPISAPEALWATYEVSLNRETEPFSYGVKKYLDHLLNEEGGSASGEDLGAFLAHRRENVKAQLVKLQGHVPELPDIGETLSQAFGG